MADTWDDISVSSEPSSAPGAGWDDISTPAPKEGGSTQIEKTVPIPRSLLETIVSHIGGSGTGLITDQKPDGSIGPGALVQPFVAGMEMVERGYNLPGKNALPDDYIIKKSFEAAPAGISGTAFKTASPQAIRRVVDAEEAATAAFGPGPTGIPQAWFDKYGSQNQRRAVVDAGERQGVSVPEFVATESAVKRGIAGGVSGTPLTGEPVRKANEDMAKSLGQRVEGLANNATREAAAPGSAAKTGILDWTEAGFRKSMDEAYKPLDALISRDRHVPLANTKKAADELTQADVESASRDGQMVIALVRDALNRKQGLTWAGLKELRTRVGERLNGDIAPEAGTSARALNKLYAALTEDVRFGVGRAGAGRGGIKAATDAFDAANAKASELFDLRRRLTEIVGREGDNSPESVFHRITAMASSTSRGDHEQLKRALDAAGSSRQSVVDTIVARLGFDEKTGNFSPERFLTDYNKRLSSEGKAALFDPDTRKHLDDIATLAEAWTAAGRQGNFSGTGRSVAITAAVAAAVTHPLLLVAQVAGTYGMSHLLSRPAGARGVAQFMDAYTAAKASQTPTRAQAAALDAAEKNLINIIEMRDGEPKKQRAEGSGWAPKSDRAPANAMAGSPAQGDNAMSPQRAPKEGDTATNPSTGERIIFRNGKWETIA